MEFVKTTETIESLLSTRELLYSGLPNYEERQTEDRSGNILEQMAAQAKAQLDAETVTQVDESALEVNEARRANDVSVSHIGKTMPSKMEWMVLPWPQQQGWTPMSKR